MKINKRQVNNTLLLLLSLLVSLLSQFPSLLTVVVLLTFILFIILFFSDDLLKLAPLFLFFNSSILYFNGVALVDIFYLIYILKNINSVVSLSKKNIPYIYLIFILYTIFVIGSNNFSLSIEILGSLIFLIFLFNDLHNKEGWDEFCKWYIVFMFSAIVYGVVNYFTADVITGNRLTLAFTDPNYAGMFLTIGLYILVLKKDCFHSIMRLFLIFITICCIFLTISSTAILCNLCVLFILLVEFNKKVKSTRFVFLKNILFLIGLIILVYLAIISNPNLMRIFERFFDKIILIRSDGISQATTGRSDIWIEHLQFFLQQDNIMNILFGGNYLTDRGFDTTLFSIVSHQVYIDSLITFGIVGTIVYVIDISKQIKYKFKNRKKSTNSKLLFIISIIWLVYSFGLSMFPFWGFILFIFINVREEALHENKEFD